MAKTIQVRVEDELKDSSDLLFSSLGLDTSTAVRMFLVAANEMEGIPFTVAHRADNNRAIVEAIKRRKTGVKSLTADESLANARLAIKAGAESEV